MYLIIYVRTYVLINTINVPIIMLITNENIIYYIEMIPFHKFLG